MGLGCGLLVALRIGVGLDVDTGLALALAIGQAVMVHHGQGQGRDIGQEQGLAGIEPRQKAESFHWVIVQLAYGVTGFSIGLWPQAFFVVHIAWHGMA